MRNGDVYKIQGMIRTGSTPEEVVHRFRNRYSEEEVRRFLPGEKKPIRRKRAPKKAEVADDIGSDNM